MLSIDIVSIAAYVSRCTIRHTNSTLRFPAPHGVTCFLTVLVLAEYLFIEDYDTSMLWSSTQRLICMRKQAFCKTGDLDIGDPANITLTSSGFVSRVSLKASHVICLSQCERPRVWSTPCTACQRGKRATLLHAPRYRHGSIQSKTGMSKLRTPGTLCAMRITGFSCVTMIVIDRSISRLLWEAALVLIVWLLSTTGQRSTISAGHGGYPPPNSVDILDSMSFHFLNTKHLPLAYHTNLFHHPLL
jgi:hypothetical protein